MGSQNFQARSQLDPTEFCRFLFAIAASEIQNRNSLEFWNLKRGILLRPQSLFGIAVLGCRNFSEFQDLGPGIFLRRRSLFAIVALEFQDRNSMESRNLGPGTFRDSRTNSIPFWAGLVFSHRIQIRRAAIFPRRASLPLQTGEIPAADSVGSQIRPPPIASFAGAPIFFDLRASKKCHRPANFSTFSPSVPNFSPNPSNFDFHSKDPPNFDFGPLDFVLGQNSASAIFHGIRRESSSDPQPSVGSRRNRGQIRNRIRRSHQNFFRLRGGSMSAHVGHGPEPRRWFSNPGPYGRLQAAKLFSYFSRSPA